MLGLFRKKDPICGMKEEKGKGMEKHGMWFCSETCLKKHEEKQGHTKKKKGCCCH